jgi:hypothetical protein
MAVVQRSSSSFTRALRRLRSFQEELLAGAGDAGKGGAARAKGAAGPGAPAPLPRRLPSGGCLPFFARPMVEGEHLP